MYAMSIHIKFFASLREKVGITETNIKPVATAGDAWDLTTHHSERPINVLVAINLEYADFASPVNDGDEVAFFPPVTGG
jgi:molybdopterin synthase sulfur carrier subunit